MKKLFSVSFILMTILSSLVMYAADIISIPAIKTADGNINKIRMLLKGDKEACLRLFKEAVEHEDPAIQIQLAYAFFGMKWGKDQEKDFSALNESVLEEFSYYPREFELYKIVYDEACALKLDYKARNEREAQVFKKAAERGYIPAVLELLAATWKLNTESFGFAVQLKPFVGKGDKTLDYYFGKALKNGSKIGSDLYYEGMYWLENSLGIRIEVPSADESFDNFKRNYVRYTDASNVYYDHDGLRHVGLKVILAPSKEAWNTFKTTKLANVKIAPIEFYTLSHDINKIKDILDSYKISGAPSNSFVKHPEQGYDMKDLFGNTVHGFGVDTITLYENHEIIGEISVRKDNFAIHTTFTDKRIQPVIDFIENVMKKCGSAGSAYAWLRQSGTQYF